VLRTVRFLNLRRLTEQPVRALLGVLAIAAGTALLVGVMIDQASLTRSFGDFNEQRAGAATLEVIGPGGPAGLDESVLPAVEAVDGVAAAVPTIQTVTIAEDAAGAERFVVVFGVDCRIEAVLGDFGCDQAQLESIAGVFAVSPRLAAAVGADGVLRTDAGRQPIANGTPIEQLDAINDGNVAAFSLRDAQRLFGHQGALSAILIVPEPGVAEGDLWRGLEEAIGEHNQVRRPGVANGAEFASIFISMLFLMSLFGLAIGAQLVHNTITLTLEERRRDLAVTGALGAPPRALLAGALTEAAVLGAVGGLLGVGGGFLVARPLVQGMSDSIDELTGLTLEVHVPGIAVVVGIVLGIAVSILAAVGPARRASRIDVAAELQGQARRDETATAAKGRRALVYVVLALAGVALAWVGQRDGAIEPWQPPVAYAGFGLTAFLSFRAAQHGAAPLLARLVEIPWLRNGPARVAASSMAGEPKRTGVMIMAVAAAIGTGVVLGNTNRSIVAGSSWVADRHDDELFVSSLPANNSLGIEAKLSPPVLERLRTVPGVAEVHEEHGFCGEHPVIGSLCVSSHNGRVTEFPVYRGRSSVAEVFAHDEVLMGPALARAQGLRPGDTFDLPTRFGMRTLKVGAIWGHPNHTGSSVTVPLATFLEMYGSRPPGNVLVVPEEGVSAAELDRRIEEAGLDPDLISFDSDELAADFTESISGFVTPFAALQRGMLIVALVAVTSTLLLVGVQRRREHGLLLAVGMAPGSLAQMVLIEAGIVGLAGAILGTAAGMVTYVAMMWVSPLMTGLSAPFRFDLLAPFTYGATGALLVVVAAAFPAWRTSRLDPIAALRYE